MVAAKNKDERATPGSEAKPFCCRRYHAQSPEAGRNPSREVLVNAAIPHNIPYTIHGFAPLTSSSLRVSQKRIASSNAARLVSHTQRVHQYMTDGNSAQSQAVHTAIFSSKHFLAIKKIGTQVRAENKLLILSKISADA